MAVHRIVRDILARQDWQLVEVSEFTALVQAEAGQRLAIQSRGGLSTSDCQRAIERAVKHCYSQALYQTCRADGAPRQHRAYQELGRYLFRIAYNCLLWQPDTYELAEECTQEALLKIFHKIEDCRDPGSFLAWCIQIVINEVRQAFRTLQRRPLASGLGSGETGGAAVVCGTSYLRENGKSPKLSLRSTTQLGAAQAVLDQELAQILITAIRSQLRSKAQQQVLLLGFIGGLDDQQIAERLGKTTANVHTLRCRALKRLRENEELLAALRAYVEDD